MPKGTSLIAQDLNSFLVDLNTNLQNLPCLARAPGEPRELLLVRKELVARDERISRLEQQLQQREEMRRMMAAEHEALKRQLDDARDLVNTVDAARVARVAAEERARSVLAGSPSAQQLLAQELQELQKAEERARQAREQRRRAAAERKAALEASLEAKIALVNSPAVFPPSPSLTAPEVPVAPVTPVPLSPDPPLAASDSTPVAESVVLSTAPPPTPPYPTSAPPEEQIAAGPSQPSPEPPLLQQPQLDSPMLQPATPPAPVVQDEASALLTPPVVVPAASPQPSIESADLEEPSAQQVADQAAAEVAAALQAASPAPTPYGGGAPEDDEDFDTMGWPDGASEQAVTPQPGRSPLPAAEAEEDNMQMMESLRAEAAFAAGQSPPSMLVSATTPISSPPSMLVSATTPISSPPPMLVSATTPISSPALGSTLVRAAIDVRASNGSDGSTTVATLRLLAGNEASASLAEAADVAMREASPVSSQPVVPEGLSTEVTQPLEMPPTPPVTSGETGHAVEVQRQELARLQEASRQKAAQLAAAQGAAQTAEQQDEEAQRGLLAAQAELVAARQAEDARLQRVAEQGPPSKKKKGGLWGAMGLKKKAAAPQPSDETPSADLAALEQAVARFTQISDASREAKATATAEAERVRRAAEEAEAEQSRVAAEQTATVTASATVESPPAAAATPASEAIRETEATAVAERTVQVSMAATSSSIVTHMPAAQGATPAAQGATPTVAHIAPVTVTVPAPVSAPALPKQSEFVSAELEFDGEDYYEEEGEDGEYYEDDGEDSDFDLPQGVDLPNSTPVLEDYLLVAKLYGPPPDTVKWDLRWVVLYNDRSLWHADDGPSEETGGLPDGAMGRLDLADVVRCDYTQGRTDELCLSQNAKCHLLRIDSDSVTTLGAWREALQK